MIRSILVVLLFSIAWPAQAVELDDVQLYVTNASTSFISWVRFRNGQPYLRRINMQSGDIPLEIAMSPNGDQLYVVADRTGLDGPGHLVRIDRNSHNITGRVAAARNSLHIALSPDGSRAYISSVNGGPAGVVHEFDTETMTVTQTIPIGQRPGALLVSADNRYVFVGLAYPSGFRVIDTDNNYAVIDMGARINLMHIEPAADNTQIAFFSGPNLEFWDIESRTLVRSVTINPTGFYDFDLSADGTKVFVPGESLQIYDANSGAELSNISFQLPDRLGHAVEVTSDGRYAFFTHTQPTTSYNHLYIADVTTGEVLHRIQLGQQATDILIHETTEDL